MALGHVLGGGSSINGLVWGRGMQRDFDGWAQNGAAGWAFDDVLPVFKAQEDWEGGANEWRGAGGPVHVRRPRDPHPAARAFLEASRQMGMPIIDDMNGPMQPGAGYINMNIGTDGTRVSAARAFLHPALSRTNLTLLMNTNVQKVNFRGKRATGVRMIVDGVPKDVTAEREVILAAGALGSPKLLMLSGVGDASALRSLGIDVVENLPGVGQNFQDQILLLGVVFKYKGKMPEHRPDSNAVEAEVYWSSGLSTAGTDINLVLHQMTAITPEVAARFGNAPEDCITIGPALVQPTSIGSVRLASSNHSDPVILDGNYLGTDFDLKATLRAIELARELGRQACLRRYTSRGTHPRTECDRAGPRRFCARQHDQLRSRGGRLQNRRRRNGRRRSAVARAWLEGLRVADSSVMPRVPTGPTNAPSFMVGGKAARLILA